MTRDEIIDLKEGCQTNNLVSEHVMQWPMIRNGRRRLVDVSRFTEADKLKWLACASRHSPEWSTDLNACREMETELERQGLSREYSIQLRALCFLNIPAGVDFYISTEFWYVAHASPLEKVKSALLTVLAESASKVTA